MKTRTLGALFGLVSLLVSMAASAAPARQNGYIVKLKPGKLAAATMGLFARDGIQVRKGIPDLNMLVTDRAPSSRLSSLIEYVAPNGYEHTMDLGPARGHPATKDEAQWDMTNIHAPEAWQLTHGSRSVVAAVSDTGAWNHPDLVANFWVNPGESGTDPQGKDKGDNGVDDDHNGYVDDVHGWSTLLHNNDVTDQMYHGTHVNGTIGAAQNGMVSGVSPVVSLMEVPFIGSDGSGEDADALEGIVYAANNGAKVINASWGSTDFNQALKDAIDYAKSKGVLFVAAAGNDSNDNDGSQKNYPASYDCENIISVAATDVDHNLAGFSNYGAKTVHVAAPGDNILSTWNPMQNTVHGQYYYAISGTSMATPHVTGTVALLYGANPNLSWRQVKDIVLSTVTPLKSLAGKVSTGGEINVYAAVKKALALK